MSSWFLPNYKQYADSVVTFNTVIDTVSFKEKKDKVALQQKLIEEEYDELIEAYALKDKGDFLKELCDLFVVSSYMLYLINTDWYKDEAAFCADNGFGSPPFHTPLSFLGDMIIVKDWRTVVKIVVGLLTSLDADVRKALQLVNQNNIDKFMLYEEDEDEVYNHMANAIEQSSDGRYTNVGWVLSNDYVVFTDSNGKVMKPIGYKKVNLKGCLKGRV